MLALSSIPALLCFIISYFFLFESPRFLMISGKEEESITILYKIAKFNGIKNFSISSENKKEI